jgi:hypothetical protein
MATISSPTVKAEIAGKKFELSMDFNAIAMAERVTGRNLMDEQTWKDMSVSTMTAVFHACAYQTDQAVTLEAVRKFTFKDAAKMVNAVREAWRIANDTPPDEPRPTEEHQAESPLDGGV